MRARITDLWNNHRWATIGVAAGVGAIVIALAGYLVLKRPGDKSCTAPCTITSEAPQPVSGTVELADVRAEREPHPLPRRAGSDAAFLDPLAVQGRPPAASTHRSW